MIMIEKDCLEILDGGGKRDRTVDPLLAKQMLSQLSYTPNLTLERTGLVQKPLHYIMRLKFVNYFF